MVRDRGVEHLDRHGRRASCCGSTPHGVSTLAARDGRPRGAVTALFEDRDGNLWVGSARGIERVRDSAFVDLHRRAGAAVGQQRSDSRRCRRAHVVRAVRRAGSIWLKDGRVEPRDAPRASRPTSSTRSPGERRRVDRPAARRAHAPARGERRGGRRRPTRRPTGWRRTASTRCTQSRDGTVWAGTLSGGVSRFSGGRFTTFTTADGLASNTISSIAEGPDGTMWFGTPNGVSAFAHGRWQSFTAKDGLPSDDVTCLTVDAGRRRVGRHGERAGGRERWASRQRRRTRRPMLCANRSRAWPPTTRGSLWIATSNHVLRVASRQAPARRAHRMPDVREYGLPDGLHSVEGVRRHRSVVADARGRDLVLARPRALDDRSDPACRRRLGAGDRARRGPLGRRHADRSARCASGSRRADSG